MNKFEQLGLSESLLKAILDLGFENPTEVQEKAIPLLLEQDTDLVALAQTGTGKTAAFGFPVIQKIDADNRNTQALILSPTRELCLQITNELKNYSKYEKGINVVAVYGGASITEQARDIKRGAQIIVATPGRMQDMINRGLVNISQINYCILDEADEMLNMGFYEDIVNILSTTPDEKSTWLFSATMPAEVARIGKQFMHNPEEITVGTKNSGSATIICVTLPLTTFAKCAMLYLIPYNYYSTTARTSWRNTGVCPTATASASICYSICWSLILRRACLPTNTTWTTILVINRVFITAIASSSIKLC